MDWASPIFSARLQNLRIPTTLSPLVFFNKASEANKDLPGYLKPVYHMTPQNYISPLKHMLPLAT